MKFVMMSKTAWRILMSIVVPLSANEVSVNNPTKGHRRFLPYVVATLMVVVLTLLFLRVGYIFTLVNLALLYLLPVLITAVRWGLWPSLYAALIGVVAFDFFFVPPVLTLTVGDARYLISFAVYVAVATFTASLAAQLRHRFQEAKERESVTSALYSLSTQIAASRNLDGVLCDIVSHAFSTFGMATAIIVPSGTDRFTVRAERGIPFDGKTDVIDYGIVQWVAEYGEMAGTGTNIYAGAPFLYMPLKTNSMVHGVMMVQAADPIGINDDSNRVRIINALAGLASVSIARIHFEEEAKIAQVTAESERLRTALLDSISHELRTPLAAIIGGATGMIESSGLLSAHDRHELLMTMLDGAMRMNRLVTNLLGMVRLESGMLRLNKQWNDVSDIIGVALGQVKELLQRRTVEVHLAHHMPAVSVDDVLIEQVLVNLLSNAIKYSPDDTPIWVEAFEQEGVLTIQIRDWGIGIHPDETERIFDKFYRSKDTNNIPGTGLGLAICKGIIQAHGGDISAQAAPNSGTMITIHIPIGDVNEPTDPSQASERSGE